MGDNFPPPEAKPIEREPPTLDAPRVPEGWDRPGYTFGGIYYPPTRYPKLNNGDPWPVADAPRIQFILARQPGIRPTMLVYVPIDGIGPVLIGSDDKEEYVQPDGYGSVRLFGKPQITWTRDGPTGHAEDSVIEALRLIRTNQFSKIYFNRSFTTVTDGMVISLIRPDVVAVARPELTLPFQYYPYESLSPGQTVPARQAYMPDVPFIARLDGKNYKMYLRWMAKFYKHLDRDSNVRHV